MSELERIIAAMRAAGANGVLFTSDDVWPFLNPPPLNVMQVGAAFREAHRRGVIYATAEFQRTTRPEGHARFVQLWRLIDPAERAQGSLL